MADIRATIAQEPLAKVGSAVASKGSQTPALVAAIRDCSPDALNALLGVIQDATANPKARRKAALKIAEFLLPKVGKKAKVLPDEYGFTVNPNLASAYHDAQLELRALVNTDPHYPCQCGKDQKIGDALPRDPTAAPSPVSYRAVSPLASLALSRQSPGLKRCGSST